MYVFREKEFCIPSTCAWLIVVHIWPSYRESSALLTECSALLLDATSLLMQHEALLVFSSGLVGWQIGLFWRHFGLFCFRALLLDAKAALVMQFKALSMELSFAESCNWWLASSSNACCKHCRFVNTYVDMIFSKKRRSKNWSKLVHSGVMYAACLLFLQGHFSALEYSQTLDKTLYHGIHTYIYIHIYIYILYIWWNIYIFITSTG